MIETTFNQFQLGDEIKRAIAILGYETPTEVQKAVIPLILNKKDVIVKSQTGSGKTAAYAIPSCELVDWDQRRPQVLVLAPTRELALQIKEDVFNIGRYKRIKVEAVFGRSSFRSQERNLATRTHVVVATPGRLLEHIERETVDLSEIKMVIIDEADEMLAMGFVEQVSEILEAIPSSATHSLFSATMPTGIQDLISNYLYEPDFVEIEAENKVKERILQQYYEVEGENKKALLENILVVENPDSSIIFCNTKLAVEEVAQGLQNLGVNPRTLHGGMEQRDRTKVINDFKHGYFRYLVATDVAARGLDIANISLVVNFDLPESGEAYTHRVGRTARFENHGKALSFVTKYEEQHLDAIEAIMESSLQKLEFPSSSLVNSRMSSFEAKQKRKPKLKKEKGHELNQEIMKLHINAGKKTKMRAGDIVGALCAIEGVTAEDIGVISIVDVSTFVEILNGKGNKVLKTLQDLPIKGRIRKVNKANESSYEQDLKKE